MNKVGIVNMAFGGATETKEGASFDNYVGIAPFYVLGVNPSKEELSKLFPEREFEKDPNYRLEKEGEAPGTFVTFIIKNNEEHKESNGISFDTRASYLLKNEITTNNDKTKIQAINDYGDTVWLTPEEFKAKTLPEYAVKQGFHLDGLRPALVGEAALIDFLRIFLNIPISKKWNNDTRTFIPKTGDELKKALCGFSLTEIKKIAEGDVSSVKSAVKIMPQNQIKFFCGVRTTSEGREFQEVCSRIPIKFGTTNYNRAEKELQNALDAGAYASSDFGTSPFILKKYGVEMTNLSGGNTPPAPLEDDLFGAFSGVGEERKDDF